MHFAKRISTVIVSLCIFSTNCVSQEDSVRSEIVKELYTDVLKEYYYRDIAKAMSDSLKARFSRGDYNGAMSRDEFIFMISRDLQVISGDGHLDIKGPDKYAFDWKAYRDELSHLSGKERRKRATRNRKELAEYEKGLAQNFEFGDISISAEGHGYLSIKSFKSDNVKKGSIIKLNEVANFFKQTKTLIIDLRDNPGGFIASLVNFLSYFSSDPNTYLFTTESIFRYDSSGTPIDKKVSHKYFSSGFLGPGSFADKKIILLINYYTFSAAKDAVFFLKKMKPETMIIGECSVNGGNSANEAPLTKTYYQANIPSGILTYEEADSVPVTCRYVCPDLIVSEDSALIKAVSLTRTTAHKAIVKEQFLKRINEPALPKISYADTYSGNYLKAIVKNSNGFLILYYGNLIRDTLQQREKDIFFSKRFQSLKFERTFGNDIRSIRLTSMDGVEEVFFKR